MDSVLSRDAPLSAGITAAEIVRLAMWWLLVVCLTEAVPRPGRRPSPPPPTFHQRLNIVTRFKRWM